MASTKSCGFCGKEKKIVSKGLCNSCYQRYRKRGSPEYIKVRKPCELEGCENPSQAHGFCWKHLKRWQKHGTTDPTRPKGWGSMEKHELYQPWKWLQRKDGLCDEWQDFWKFVEDVGKKPKSEKGNLRFYRIDKNLPASINNYEWKEYQSGKRSESIYQKEYRKSVNGQIKIKDRYLKKHYGISLDDYEKMFEKQNGVCAICGDPNMSERYKYLAVDHCHETGRIRGLLCDACNKALGGFKDSIDVLKSAVEYLNPN